jgi:two-component system, NtrC family, sensor histidine kinase GlrK
MEFPMIGRKAAPERLVQGRAHHRRARLMRLFTHLVISHSTPVIVVTLALALMLAALVRISMVLATLNDAELSVLQEEGHLHRAAWALDVAMRHGQADCANAVAAAEVGPRIEPAVAQLRTAVERAAAGAMRDVAEGYLDTASEIFKANACEGLLGTPLQARRAQLDEQLTDLWVARLDELHAAVAQKDENARSMAVSATWMGIPLAAFSFVLAMLIARRMARIVNLPLAGLAAMAKRVGEGDFRTSVQVEGPAEILALAEELERMRFQLQQLDSLKQGFLASVSHELRTPLSKIREALALLEDGAVGESDPRQMRVIRIARAACESEIRMVTTLLDLSRLRSGSPIRIRDGASLDRVLHTALGDEEAEATARGVELELVTAGGPSTGRLDPVLVERAVANLVRNAVSVSKNGQKVRVERFLESRHGDREERWARVVVSDQGPGVPEEIRHKVFDAFVTHAVSASGKAVGVGLGLALAREVAQAHGGDLELIDVPGRGATFQMWLPMDADEAAASHPPGGVADSGACGIMAPRP